MLQVSSKLKISALDRSLVSGEYLLDFLKLFVVESAMGSLLPVSEINFCCLFAEVPHSKQLVAYFWLIIVRVSSYRENQENAGKLNDPEKTEIAGNFSERRKIWEFY